MFLISNCYKMNDRSGNVKVALIIDRFGMGNAPEELSHTLLKNYLTLIISEQRIPAYICMYGEGVKVACKNSGFTDELVKLESMGSKIVICKTCLIFYNLLDKVETGSVGTMLDIIDIQHNSTKLIKL